MNTRWQLLGIKLWEKSRKPLKICGLIIAGLMAAYISSQQSREREFGIASSRATGLAAYQDFNAEPLALWRQSSIFPNAAPAAMMQKGVAGGIPGRVSVDNAIVAERAEEPRDRKLVRTASLNMLVKSPSQSTERIIRLAQDSGGFLVSSQLYGGPDALNASLNIRVPANKFDEVRAQIRALALHVDSESMDAQDVTRQYVDEDARLRNLRAQEQQYLSVLRKAATVKDTLEVSEKLNDVRGAIEEKQAEFDTLSKQTETVAISISLHSQADAEVFGLHWRPLYQLKVAAREGLDGFGNYFSSISILAFYLPTFVLWVFTILAGVAIAWRVLRFGVKMLFPRPKVGLPASAGTE